jgi:hypothetical protein
MAKDEVIKRLENSWEMLSNKIDHAQMEFLKMQKRRTSLITTSFVGRKPTFRFN